MIYRGKKIDYYQVYPGSLVQGISYVLENCEEAAGSSEALVNLYETAWCHVQKLVIFVLSASISVTRCHILQNILRCDMRMKKLLPCSVRFGILL
jgi:hypothetical protein